MWTRLPKFCQRRLARWLGRKPFRMRASSPVISFTFDDFPRSALFQGGAILREYEFLGTYYTSFGLMGRIEPTGEIFTHADLDEFARQQHEIGCHTFDHCDSWNTAPAEFEASILRNQKMLAREMPRSKMTSLSYPISYPRPQTKRRTARYYNLARGGGQTFNAGITDLNYLKAFFIEQSREDIDGIKQVIDQNMVRNGWLIFATHDVCDSPTRFGCTPRCFRELVAYAAESGAKVLPMHEAWTRIYGQSRG